MSYVLRFRVRYILTFYFTFGAFLAFSSLGAGSGKRTQKPLGAHQDRFFDRNEGEHGCIVLQTKLRTVYCFLRWKF
jgi:hypothetical protein